MTISAQISEGPVINRAELLARVASLASLIEAFAAESEAQGTLAPEVVAALRQARDAAGALVIEGPVPREGGRGAGHQTGTSIYSRDPDQNLLEFIVYEHDTLTEPNQAAAPTEYIDNPRTRVTEWRFAPGASTGWHRHELDYVIVPLSTGRLKLLDADGNETIAELQVGVPYFREAGVEHDVINDNAFEFAFMEVEIK